MTARQGKEARNKSKSFLFVFSFLDNSFLPFLALLASLLLLSSPCLALSCLPPSFLAFSSSSLSFLLCLAFLLASLTCLAFSFLPCPFVVPFLSLPALPPPCPTLPSLPYLPSLPCLLLPCLLLFIPSCLPASFLHSPSFLALP